MEIKNEMNEKKEIEKVLIELFQEEIEEKFCICKSEMIEKGFPTEKICQELRFPDGIIDKIGIEEVTIKVFATFIDNTEIYYSLSLYPIQSDFKHQYSETYEEYVNIEKKIEIIKKYGIQLKKKEEQKRIVNILSKKDIFFRNEKGQFEKL